MKHLYNRKDKRILKSELLESKIKRKTLSFYQYAQIKNPPFFRDHLYSILSECDTFGRIYIASEGINGQISIPEEKFVAFKETLYSISFLDQCRLNIAIEDNGQSFIKLIIKVRPKIVADGLDDESFDVTDKGIHLDANAFNALSSEENTIIVDMRNHYESEVGHFKNAICPDVETFKEALPVVEEMLDANKDANLIMYCTGGIRCEKASAYYKHKGFKNVYQLEGGIIEYARQVKANNLENKFKGKNFVFDERLGEKISNEVIAKCHQCGAECDTHVNCKNDACHILFIQCNSCAESYGDCCSLKCKQFNSLEKEERDKLKATLQFNGTKFGKGRYKALHKDEVLDIS